ncbi:iron-sulfur cluster biosynthesis family protein [Paenibacillus spiritus]|uniref:Iron-sulfur cluster biosynthesis family protein n=1 Tax=Paenibacillus spiritus TaxID=2496557 RepID=A0A5J5GAR6_9BACL|nr:MULTISPECIES: iron-sulfur cluster biosynthesis family protein [Paenibacillus]KAA9004215.1 iron-sulfur cluster biosynthesis family protein [Paenibacillus spiritus]
MRIELDTLTEERLRHSLKGRPGIFKLYYDTEDCGCNGVLVIQIVEEPYPTDIRIQEEPLAFVVDRQQESQFDEEMRLRADPDYPSYSLSSDGTWFGVNIRVKDLRP